MHLTILGFFRYIEQNLECARHQIIIHSRNKHLLAIFIKEYETIALNNDMLHDDPMKNAQVFLCQPLLVNIATVEIKGTVRKTVTRFATTIQKVYYMQDISLDDKVQEHRRGNTEIV